MEVGGKETLRLQGTLRSSIPWFLKNNTALDVCGGKLFYTAETLTPAERNPPQGSRVGGYDFVKTVKGCKRLLNSKICYERALSNHFMQQILQGWLKFVN